MITVISHIMPPKIHQPPGILEQSVKRIAKTLAQRQYIVSLRGHHPEHSMLLESETFNCAFTPRLHR